MSFLPRVDKLVLVMESTRRLWMSVLLQAFEDLEQEEFGSYWYNQSMAFFFGSGDWVEGRRDICDFLSIEPSDVRRPALRIANKRRLAAGLPPLQPQATTPRLATQRASEPAAAVPRPLPRLVAVHKPPEPEPEYRRRGRAPSKRWTYNPFDPFRKLPSEERREAAE
jgi:hypothetical protein